MSFANTLRNAGNTTTGPKGATNIYDPGSAVIALNNKLLQDSTDETVEHYFQKALAEINHNQDAEAMMRLIITIINKRDFRKGGEGARRIFYRLLLHLYNSGYKQLVVDMIKFIPDIGYYNDWPNLVQEINKEAPQSKQTSRDHIAYFQLYDPLIREIARCAFSQIERDTAAMADGSNEISLIGKWLARKDKSQDKHLFWYMPLFKPGTTDVKGLYKQTWVNWLTRYRYLDTPLYLGTVVEKIPPAIHAKYRRVLSALNRHLKTPEVNMCAQNYAQIRFERAASKFLNRSMAALLNEHRKVAPAPHQALTGNRYPDLADRVECREKFLEYLPKMKGAAVEFYEIIQKVITTKSETQQVVLRAQWDAKVKAVREEIKQFREELYAELQKLCAEKGIECPPMPKYPDILPLIDCSGSMTCAAQAPGVKSERPLTCLLLAVSLGMGFADVNEGPFQCMSISYSNYPELMDLPRSMSLKERFQRITSITALSTNYLSTQQLIVDYAKKHNVPQDELPETYCFSDEGFDIQIQGISSYNYYGTKNRDPSQAWKTTYDNIQDIYKRAGYDTVPQTYFHNLSGNNRYGHQADKDRKGVSMLQGFTSASFKYPFVGNLPAQVEALRPKKETTTAGGGAASVKTSDLETMAKSTHDDFESMIHRSHFDLFRCLMHFSQEGVLKDYHFDKIEECPALPVVPDPTVAHQDPVAPLTEEMEGFQLAGGGAPPDQAPPTAERTWTESILGRFW